MQWGFNKTEPQLFQLPHQATTTTTNTNSHIDTNTLLDSNSLLRQLSWLLVNLASLSLFDGLSASPYASY